MSERFSNAYFTAGWVGRHAWVSIYNGNVFYSCRKSTKKNIVEKSPSIIIQSISVITWSFSPNYFILWLVNESIVIQHIGLVWPCLFSCPVGNVLYGAAVRFLCRTWHQLGFTPHPTILVGVHHRGNYVNFMLIFTSTQNRGWLHHGRYMMVIYGNHWVQLKLHGHRCVIHVNNMMYISANGAVGSCYNTIGYNNLMTITARMKPQYKSDIEPTQNTLYIAPSVDYGLLVVRVFCRIMIMTKLCSTKWDFMWLYSYRMNISSSKDVFISQFFIELCKISDELIIIFW